MSQTLAFKLYGGYIVPSYLLQVKFCTGLCPTIGLLVYNIHTLVVDWNILNAVQ